jgi:hypothetical protein
MKIAPVLAVIAALSAFAAADPIRFSLETDPIAIGLFHGGELAAGLRHDHLRFDLALAAHERYPAFIAEADSRDAGWRYGQEFVAVNAMYFFGTGRGGLFAGPGINVARQHFTAPGAMTTSDDTRLELIAAVGYQWFPLAHQDLYLAPWAFAQVNLPALSGTTGGYQLPVVSPAFTLHVGYEF